MTLAIGGKCDPRFGGGPIEVDAEIVLFSEGEYTGDGPMIGGLKCSFGDSAVIRTRGGIDILL